MSYASKYLKAHGQTATINRTTPITAYVAMKRSSKSTSNPGVRDAAWEGLAEVSSNLVSGEIMTVGLDKYLVQSVNADIASGELVFFAVKTNAVLTPQRITASLDADNNIVETWSWTPSGTTVDAFGQVVTGTLRQYEVGLLESTKYIFFVPATVGLQKEDRIVLASENLMVNDIDSLMLEGVTRVQCGSDTRA